MIDSSKNEDFLAPINAIPDTTIVCTKSGINNSFDDWPCSYLPKAIIADRAEMRSPYKQMCSKCVA